MGTFDYMDPEYLRSGEYSARSDVYALGMVLLQLLTGREGAQVGAGVSRMCVLGVSGGLCTRVGHGAAAAADGEGGRAGGCRCIKDVCIRGVGWVMHTRWAWCCCSC